jgi:hypothetical protein
MVLGLTLGGLLTKLSELFLPESAARDFLVTAVGASIGPLSIDLAVVAFTLGPISVTLNVLTLVGISIVALIGRSWM